MKKLSDAARKEKVKELFTLSHKLLEAAKQLSEYHAEELRHNMQHAIDSAKIATQNDLKKLHTMQQKAATDASKRMIQYQKKAKVILRNIGNNASGSAEKYFERARDAIGNWVNETEKKAQIRSDQLAKVTREVSSAGTKILKEGRKILNDSLKKAKKDLQSSSINKKTIKSKKPSVKKLTPRKSSPPVKKSPKVVSPEKVNPAPPNQ